MVVSIGVCPVGYVSEQHLSDVVNKLIAYTETSLSSDRAQGIRILIPGLVQPCRQQLNSSDLVQQEQVFI